MKKKMRPLTLLLFFLSATLISQAQDNAAMGTADFPDNTEAAIRADGVNTFTGLPSISVPIYSYKGNGLSWGVSIDYNGGGIQINQGPSVVGLGWNLNCNGVIARMVRGAPDDWTSSGYMWTAANPTDIRANASKYYFDTLDSEQDIYTFNFNGRSGKFVIGKNKQIVVMPSSKIKISYSVSGEITSFRIVTEDGVKYDFNTMEITTPTATGTGSGYGSYVDAWYLSDVISAFNTDTIKLNYSSVTGYGTAPYTSVGLIAPSTNTLKYISAPYWAASSYTVNNISSISFPDKKTISFIYTGNTISKIKIYDTVFRHGYALQYATGRSQLTGITPYTNRQADRGYGFTYSDTVPVSRNQYGIDDDQNRYDYWGFYNAAIANGADSFFTNDYTMKEPNPFPKLSGSSWGTDRTATAYAVANTLTSVWLPTGGTIYYYYGQNDHYPYTKTANTLSISGSTNTTNNITFGQVFSTKQMLTFALDKSVSRTGTAPITGSGTVTINIKSTDGTILYATTSFSLFDLFDLGIKTWSFNLANGTYSLQTVLSTGTTVTGSFPINVGWETRAVDGSTTADQCGGLRVNMIDKDNMTMEYDYLTADGKSSGFLGDIPQYTYPFRQTVAGTVTDYTAISSQPVDNMNYAQGAVVGYSRVVVYNGYKNHNMGETVYEYTGLADVNSNITTSAFPFAPQDLRDWGIGLPKRTTVYDSSGVLQKSTTYSYKLDTTFFVNDNFKSTKMGYTAAVYSASPPSVYNLTSRVFVGQEYYPSTGHAYLTSVVDTLFNSDGSKNTTYSNYVYDTNYNVTKVIRSYNRQNGTQLEKRIYYPYNYYLTSGAVKQLKDSGILSTIVATEDWITGDANPRIVAGNITDLQVLASKQVVPATVYSLESNAPVPQTTIGLFDSSKINRSTTYFRSEESLVKYDASANLLQTKNNVTGISNTVLMDYYNLYPVAKVSNAAWADVAYTSFESDGSGNWTIGSTARDNTGGLTGKQGYNLTSGNVTKTGLTTTTTYIVSVWAKTGASVSINGTAQSTPIATQNGWNMYFTTVTGTSTITVSGSGVIDELRAYPKDANMMTYAYEPSVGVTGVADANSTVMYTEYDSLLRVKVLRDKDKNILKRYDYADTDSLISTLPKYTVYFTWDPNFTCQQDSVYTDINPFSDTYKKVTYVNEGTNYCTCSQSANYPMYKIVGGVCELGTKVYSSSVYEKINNPNGPTPPQVWGWACTWHYVWSDCSVSSDQIEYNTTGACTVSSGCGVQ